MRTVLREPRRLVSSALAIILGVAFTCATLILGSSLSRSYTDQVAGRVGDASVVVTGSALSPATVKAIGTVPGVTATRPLVEYGTMVGTPEFYVQIVTLPASGKTTVVQGRLPAATGEVVINDDLAQVGHLSVGDKLPWKEGSGDTIVGIVKPGSDATSSTASPLVLAPDATALRLSGGNYALVMVSGNNPDALVASIKALPGISTDKASVATAADWTAKKVAAYTNNTSVTTYVLLIFGVIAFFVAALVISNTFSILVAQNTRRLALLRCLGASRAQTFRQVLSEAFLTAAVAGLIGLGVGWGLVSLLPLLAPSVFGAEAMTPDAVALIAPWLTGVVVTVAAAALPARAATRVPPLAALRPDLAPASGRAIGAFRTTMGILTFVAGGAGLVAAAVIGKETGVLIGVVAGVLNFAGVLLLGPWWIPAAAAALGRPFRGHIVGQLAGENTRRTPRRAAATAGALLIGTTLVSMVLTGAAIANTTIQDTVDRRHPVEILIYGDVTSQLTQRVAAVKGVAAAVDATVADGTVEANGKSTQVMAIGLTTAQATPLGWASAENLAPDEIAMGSSTIANGATVNLTIGGRAIPLRARIVPQAAMTAVNPAVLSTPGAETSKVMLVKLTADANPATLLGDIGTALDGASVTITSAHAEREMIAQSFAAVLAVVLGLLGVSVLISLVGVGNTLGLSVLERRRETALLRALGLDASAVKRLLGGEALLLGGVASVAGVLLGIGYGIAGMEAMLGKETAVTIGIPYAQLLLLIGLTLGLAWIASVLPAGRAASVSPATALAQE